MCTIGVFYDEKLLPLAQYIFVRILCSMNNAGKFAQNLGARFRAAAQSANGGNGGGGTGGGGGGPVNIVAGILRGVAVLGGLGYGAYSSVVIVQPGHMGVVYNRYGGLDERAKLTEGINFVLPWFQRERTCIM